MTSVATSDMLTQIAQDYFDTETAVRTLIEVSESQINHAIENEDLIEGAGEICIQIHKSDKYRLVIKHNGSGIDSEQLEEYVTIVGRSGEIEDEHGMWHLAPFLFSDEYMLKSNPRHSDDKIMSHVTGGGFNILDEEMCDFEFLGTKLNICIESDTTDIVELGKKIREKARQSTDIHIVYELYDGDGIIEDMHFNSK